jgi:hypothetical protein
VHNEDQRGNLTGSPAVSSIAARAVPCTRSWASGVSGDWADSTKWLPVGRPSVSDDICISASGTYVVTFSTLSWWVRSLQVGGPGVAATLRVDPQGGNMTFTNDVTVSSGSKIVLVDDAGTTSFFVNGAGAGLTNDGTIEVSGSCGCNTGVRLRFENFVNNGTLTIASSVDLSFRPNGLSVNTGSFRNNGIVTVAGADPSRISNYNGGATIRQQGGSITGTQRLEIRGDSIDPFTPRMSLVWSGGALGVNANDPTKGILRAYGTEVTLSNTALAGRLEVAGALDASTITGLIGPGVHLWLAAIDDHEFSFVRNQPGPTINDGTLEVATGGGGGLFAGHDITLSFPGLINRHLLKVSGGQDVEVVTDSMVNTDSVDVDGALRVGGNLIKLRNKAAIVVNPGSSLEVHTGAEFHAVAGSAMTGELRLSNGGVQGTGTVGDIVSLAGSIRPGSPIGTLTASSVTMDQATGLTIDMAGTSPGTHDQLVVTGNVTYGGTLSVVNVSPFLGGYCGDVASIITDNSSGARGAFNKFNGLVQGIVNHWRVYNPANSYQLVGHAPFAGVFVNESFLDVTEGGSAATYQICLGTNTPTADVVVTTARVLTNIEVFPASVTFPIASWQLPKTVTVVALNDGAVEGLHSDTVTNTVTSADPAYNGTPAGTLPVSITDNDDNDEDGGGVNSTLATMRGSLLRPRITTTARR